MRSWFDLWIVEIRNYDAIKLRILEPQFNIMNPIVLLILIQFVSGIVAFTMLSKRRNFRNWTLADTATLTVCFIFGAAALLVMVVKSIGDHEKRRLP